MQWLQYNININILSIEHLLGLVILLIVHESNALHLLLELLLIVAFHEDPFLHDPLGLDGGERAVDVVFSSGLAGTLVLDPYLALLGLVVE